MSAFLGPIHYWLYHKVSLQESLIERIAHASVQNGWNAALAQKIDEACGEADQRALEEVIDQSNIHGWLQGRIGICEARLAFAVTALLREDIARLQVLEQTAFEFGKAHAVQPGAGADDAFQALNDSLLDGMPCDHVNMVTQKDADAVVWQQMQCVHEVYWEQVGGDISVYYALRAQIIKGMLENSGLNWKTDENKNFEIRKGDNHVQR